MSLAELKITLFRELDKLGKQELQEIYQLLMNRVKKAKNPPKRKIGTLKGTLLYMADDFDAHLARKFLNQQAHNGRIVYDQCFHESPEWTENEKQAKTA